VSREKGEKEKDLCFFWLSLEVLLYSILLPNLVVEKMDLLEDGASNENLQEDDDLKEAEASLSLFKSRSKLKNSEI
jgi:hypothetical protein